MDIDEKKVNQAVKECGLVCGTTVPVDINRLLAHYNIEVREVMMDAVNTAMLIDNAIFVNSRLSEEEKRSAVVKELGHVALGHRRGKSRKKVFR